MQIISGGQATLTDCLPTCLILQYNMIFDKLTVKPYEQRKCGGRDGIRPDRPFTMKCVFYFCIFGANILKVLSLNCQISASADSTSQTEGFDPGSERTLAAWLRHASRTD